VQAGAFLSRENAQARVDQLRGAGFDAYILPADELFKVYVGAFADRANAERMAERLRAIGFEAIIVQR
jgi:cell division septation protein DedD